MTPPTQNRLWLRKHLALKLACLFVFVIYFVHPTITPLLVDPPASSTPSQTDSQISKENHAAVVALSSNPADSQLVKHTLSTARVLLGLHRKDLARLSAQGVAKSNESILGDILGLVDATDQEITKDACLKRYKPALCTAILNQVSRRRNQKKASAQVTADNDALQLARHGSHEFLDSLPDKAVNLETVSFLCSEMWSYSRCNSVKRRGRLLFLQRLDQKEANSICQTLRSDDFCSEDFHSVILSLKVLDVEEDAQKNISESKPEYDKRSERPDIQLLRWIAFHLEDFCFDRFINFSQKIDWFKYANYDNDLYHLDHLLHHLGQLVKDIEESSDFCGQKWSPSRCSSHKLMADDFFDQALDVILDHFQTFRAFVLNKSLIKPLTISSDSSYQTQKDILNVCLKMWAPALCSGLFVAFDEAVAYTIRLRSWTTIHLAVPPMQIGQSKQPQRSLNVRNSHEDTNWEQRAKLSNSKKIPKLRRDAQKLTTTCGPVKNSASVSPSIEERMSNTCARKGKILRTWVDAMLPPPECATYSRSRSELDRCLYVSDNQSPIVIVVYVTFALSCACLLGLLLLACVRHSRRKMAPFLANSNCPDGTAPPKYPGEHGGYDGFMSRRYSEVQAPPNMKMTMDGVNDCWTKWVIGKGHNDKKSLSKPPRVSAPRIPSLKLPKPSLATVRRTSGLEPDTYTRQKPRASGATTKLLRWGSNF